MVHDRINPEDIDVIERSIRKAEKRMRITQLLIMFIPVGLRDSMIGMMDVPYARIPVYDSPYMDIVEPHGYKLIVYIAGESTLSCDEQAALVLQGRIKYLTEDSFICGPEYRHSGDDTAYMDYVGCLVRYIRREYPHIQVKTRLRRRWR